MNPALLWAVQWLHIVAGIVWAGGVAFFALVVWPALLTRPPAEARALYTGMERFAGPVLGTAGGLSILLGILRGTWLGPVQSWDAWWGTRYGQLMTVAFLVVFALLVYGGYMRRRMDTRVFNEGQWHPGAARFIWRSSVITLAGLGVVLACMVMMRVGI